MPSWEHMLDCPQVNKLSVPAFSSAVPFLHRQNFQQNKVPQQKHHRITDYFFSLHHEAVTLPFLTCHASYHNQGSNSIPFYCVFLHQAVSRSCRVQARQICNCFNCSTSAAMHLMEAGLYLSNILRKSNMIQ